MIHRGEKRLHLPTTMRKYKEFFVIS
jgi:hypothetical protein